MIINNTQCRSIAATKAVSRGRRPQLAAALLGGAFCLAQVASAQAADNDLSRMSWLSGVWESATDAKTGTQMEYIYGPAFHGVVISTLIRVTNGRADRYELRTIRNDNGHVIFHELAFNGDLSPADPVPPRPLESQDATHINFVDMKVTRLSKDRIHVSLTIRHPPGAPPHALEEDLQRTMRFTNTSK
jgi:hypothetical protein